MAQRVVRIRLKSKFTYADFLKDLASQELSSDKLLSVVDILQIAEMRSSSLEYIVYWILNTTMLVCKECLNIFTDRIPKTKFVGVFFF